MDNLLFAISVVFPLIIIMLIGYLLKKTKVTDNHSINIMNRMTFKVFLPALLFSNIYSLEPDEAINKDNLGLLLLATLSIIAVVILSNIIFSLIVKDKKKCSVMIQGTFRSNLVLFGIPIAASIYGDAKVATVSLLAAFIVPLFNFLAVLILEMYRGGKMNYKKLLIGIITNPLIVSSLIALFLVALRIKLPEIILSPLSSLSKVATPLAFIVLGGSFEFKNIKKNMKYLTSVMLGKLLLVPAVVFAVAYFYGFRGEAIVALIGTMASPTAVSSFTMAKEMDADGELAGQIVVVTSIASVFTIFLWVYLLRTYHII